MDVEVAADLHVIDTAGNVYFAEVAVDVEVAADLHVIDTADNVRFAGTAVDAADLHVVDTADNVLFAVGAAVAADKFRFVDDAVNTDMHAADFAMRLTLHAVDFVDLAFAELLVADIVGQDDSAGAAAVAELPVAGNADSADDIASAGTAFDTVALRLPADDSAVVAAAAETAESAAAAEAADHFANCLAETAGNFANYLA